jgi:hypothetical protein
MDIFRQQSPVWLIEQKAEAKHCVYRKGMGPLFSVHNCTGSKEQGLRLHGKTFMGADS